MLNGQEQSVRIVKREFKAVFEAVVDALQQRLLHHDLIITAWNLKVEVVHNEV